MSLRRINRYREITSSFYLIFAITKSVSVPVLVSLSRDYSGFSVLFCDNDPFPRRHQSFRATRYVNDTAKIESVTSKVECGIRVLEFWEEEGYMETDSRLSHIEVSI